MQGWRRVRWSAGPLSSDLGPTPASQWHWSSVQSWLTLALLTGHRIQWLHHLQLPIGHWIHVLDLSDSSRSQWPRLKSICYSISITQASWSAGLLTNYPLTCKCVFTMANYHLSVYSLWQTIYLSVYSLWQTIHLHVSVSSLWQCRFANKQSTEVCVTVVLVCAHVVCGYYNYSYTCILYMYVVVFIKCVYCKWKNFRVKIFHEKNIRVKFFLWAI